MRRTNRVFFCSGSRAQSLWWEPRGEEETERWRREALETVRGSLRHDPLRLHLMGWTERQNTNLTLVVESRLSVCVNFLWLFKHTVTYSVVLLCSYISQWIFKETLIKIMWFMSFWSKIKPKIFTSRPSGHYSCISSGSCGGSRKPEGACKTKNIV